MTMITETFLMRAFALIACAIVLALYTFGLISLLQVGLVGFVAGVLWVLARSPS